MRRAVRTRRDEQGSALIEFIGLSLLLPSLAPGTHFTVCVRTTAALPLTARGPLSGAGSVTVNGTYSVAVDAYREAR